MQEKGRCFCSPYKNSGVLWKGKISILLTQSSQLTRGKGYCNFKKIRSALGKGLISFILSTSQYGSLLILLTFYRQQQSGNWSFPCHTQGSKNKEQDWGDLFFLPLLLSCCSEATKKAILKPRTCEVLLDLHWPMWGLVQFCVASRFSLKFLLLPCSQTGACTITV